MTEEHISTDVYCWDKVIPLLYSFVSSHPLRTRLPLSHPFIKLRRLVQCKLLQRVPPAKNASSCIFAQTHIWWQ